MVRTMEFTISLNDEVFVKQRTYLINRLHRVSQGLTDPGVDGFLRDFLTYEKEILEGLINLTDSIADTAHDKYGMNTLIKETDNE